MLIAVAVAVAKAAGILTLLTLATIVIRIVRSDPDEQVDAVEHGGPDLVGRSIMRGFTLMLIVGVSSAFAISIGVIVQAL